MGLSSSDTFVLTVANVNDAPTLVHPLPSSYSAPVGSAFALSAATVTAAFHDVDMDLAGSGEHLTYTATMQDGTALPGWLTFAGSNNPTLYGTPPDAANGLLLGVKITATDTGSLSVADSFQISIPQADHAPTLGAAIASFNARQDTLYLYEIPAGSFADADLPNDRLTYAASVVGGGTLPAWLKFDADTHTFIGTPGNSAVTLGDAGGTLNTIAPLQVQVTATDAAGLSATSNVFQIGVVNVNDAPVLVQHMANQTGFIGQSLSGLAVAGNFNDVDRPYGDQLTYAAALVGGGALPGWLRLDAGTGQFSSGILARDESGTYTIKVTATDSHAAAVADIFNLTVRLQDNAPILATQTANQTAQQGQPFILALDKTTFTDTDAGDVLTWAATLSDGHKLPDWLVFDAAAQTFVGTPKNADVGALAITVTATDKDGLSAQEVFALTVNNVNDAPTLAHAIPNQYATLDSATPFHYSVDPATFTDIDKLIDPQSTLTLSATLLDGTHNGAGTLLTADAGWLRFDGTTFSLNGTSLPDTNTVSIKVTAMDNGTHNATDSGPTPSLSVSDIFNLTLNHAPTGPTAITAPQDAVQGQTFYFTLPANTFTDLDTPYGDTLTLSATLGDGTDLSSSSATSWLHFNQATQTFYGTPGNANVGSLDVTVWATDTAGDHVSAPLHLVVDNVNDAPILVNQIANQMLIADQIVDTGKTLNFSVQGYFDDPDLHVSGTTEKLSYSASLLSGDLPGWLSFDATTGTFSGTAPNSQADLVVKVTATDLAGATASDVFKLHVLLPAQAPTVASQIVVPTTAVQDHAFAFQIPKTTFAGPAGDWLSLTSSALPNWLHFDADTGTFFGTPGSSDLVALKHADNLAGIPTSTNQAVLAITVTAIDATDLHHASVSDVFTLTVNNGNDAPVVNSASPAMTQTVTQGTFFQFALSGDHFTDADAVFGDTLTYTAALSGGAALPSWLSFNPTTHLFSGTPDANTPSQLSLRLTATDSGQLSVSDAITLHILPPNHAPTVASAEGNQSISVGHTLTYQVPLNTFNDADQGDTLTYTATAQDGSALPGWLHFDPATRTFFGTPIDQGVTVNGVTHIEDDSGVVNVKVIATDSHGAAVADTFSLTVTNDTNHAPVLIDPTASQHIPTAIRAATFQFQLAADTFLDPDKGDTLTLSADRPDWLSFDPGTRMFTGTPTPDATTANVTLTATDAAGLKGYDVFTLKVMDLNHAPLLGSVVADQVSDQSVQQGAAFHYQFLPDAFTDPDGDALTLSATLMDGSQGGLGTLLTTSSASWLHFDPSTRTFTGQPGTGDVGTLNVKLTATDPSGASVSDTFNILVGNVNDAPTVADSLHNQDATRGAAFTYQFAADTFADGDAPYGDTLTYAATTLSGDALPTWLHFDPSTRTFSGTPESTDAVGVINVKVTATDRGLDNPLATGSTATPNPLSVSSSFSLNVAASQSGTLLDSKVVGITYTTTTSSGRVTHSGWTDDTGAFQFNPGDTVTFSIGGTVQNTNKILSNPATAMGGIALGHATAGKVITPADLAGSSNVATITNMLRLLQTMDADGDPSNGITFTSAELAVAAYTPLSFNLSADAFAASGTVINYLKATGNTSGSLVSTEAAWQHFLGTLASVGSGSSGILTTSEATPIPVVLQGTPLSYQLSLAQFSVSSGAILSPVSSLINQIASARSGGSSGTTPYAISSLDGKTSGKAALPADGWLSFDQDTGLFSGTPGNNDVGTVAVLVTATANNVSSNKVVNITVLNANDAPTFTAGSLKTQSATLTTPFFYQIPTTAFSDADMPYGDRLTFSATQADGNVLPTWLCFDRQTGTFSGTPTTLANAGTVIVKVTATDTANTSVSGLFSLNVTAIDHAPTLADPIASQTVPTAMEGTAFRFQLASNTFKDVDVNTLGDHLTYSAQLAGGGSSTALPSWLHFDPDTGTFSGTPTHGDVGTLTVKVTATDLAGAQVSDSFTLGVQQLPHAPTLVDPIASQLGQTLFTQGQPINFKLDPHTFTVDAGDAMKLTATLADGTTALPAWLTFDPLTASFTGTPTAGGVLHLEVLAQDTTNTLSTASYFDLSVKAINHAPTVVTPVNVTPPHASDDGSTFSYTVPTGLFAYADNDHPTFP
ncbi:MAG: putative Ig domain-containing protein, partial [Magnetococcales bacterium]|nr:putative Ig domain-containing protein [Magnetococcales bacterium]